MDPQLQAFRDTGLANGIKMLGHDVTVSVGPGDLRVLSGVRSELTIDPGSVKPGGFNYRRAFTLRVPDKVKVGDVMVDVLSVVKVGMTATDAYGHGCKIVRYERGHNSVLYVFGNTNA
jgi:hypothetical protein